VADCAFVDTVSTTELIWGYRLLTRLRCEWLRSFSRWLAGKIGLLLAVMLLVVILTLAILMALPFLLMDWLKCYANGTRDD